MPQELIQIDSRRPFTRVFLIVIILFTTVWCGFGFRWYLGNTLAEYFNTAQNSIEMAQTAISISPNDPLPHWRLAQVYQQKLTADQTALIVAEYEKAVSLSPNDYRYWMSFGIALERSGDIVRAERALRQAIVLAPAYALPHWYLANLLLRSARYDEAFAELRVASDSDTTLRPQLFRVAIDLYGNDVEGLKSAIGENPSNRAELAVYLLQIQRVDDGLKMWGSLSQQDQKANPGAVNSILTALINLHRYHHAMNILNSMAPSEELKTELGRVVDGSFENTHSANSVFEWHVNPATHMQIGIDPEISHSGVRSLRIVFQVRDRLDAINAYTLVPVAANTQYDFEYYVRTEKLQGADAPFILILNANDNSLLTASSQAAQGSNDWSRVNLSFKTGEKTEAVRIQFARIACEKDKICPLFGAVWYDDFSIKRHD